MMLMRPCGAFFILGANSGHAVRGVLTAEKGDLGALILGETDGCGKVRPSKIIIPATK